MVAVVLLAVLLPMLLTAAFLLGRHLNRRQHLGDQLSLVTRQHIHLFQGGQLNEKLVESTKTRFRDLLEQGDIATVEASMRPGIQYAVQVRALTEIGTEDAGRILERQLQRRLTSDELEQSWYWIDLANGLRLLNRQESLPHLLRCAEEAGEVPLGHFFAAETVCFLSFSGYVQNFESPLGKAALRLLHRVLEGLRHGVPPQVVIEARLGESVERLWDHRPEMVHPVVVRVFFEALRFLRRVADIQSVVGLEGTETESFRWQVSRLIALEPMLVDYLEEAPAVLCQQLAHAEPHDARDILRALADLRADTATTVLPFLDTAEAMSAGLAIETLAWSHGDRVGPWLRQQLRSHLPAPRRSPWRLPRLGRRRAKSRFPLPPLLRALRGHPDKESETLLLRALELRPLDCRQAALYSMGWWEPVARQHVLAGLSKACRDGHPEIRQSARSAMARLGERYALQWFRQALTSEDSNQVHEAIQTIASENLMLLWPDLDRLTEADNPDIAQHAREAVQRLFEEMEWDMRQTSDS